MDIFRNPVNAAMNIGTAASMGTPLGPFMLALRTAKGAYDLLGPNSPMTRGDPLSSALGTAMGAVDIAAPFLGGMGGAAEAGRQAAKTPITGGDMILAGKAPGVIEGGLGVPGGIRATMTGLPSSALSAGGLGGSPIMDILRNLPQEERTRWLTELLTKSQRGW